MYFRDIAAQEAAIRTLQRALQSGKVPHAYIFTGPPGVGKGLTASAMASALNCSEARDDACGECISCKKIARGVHPDVFQLTLPEKKRSIPVDAVREMTSRLAIRAHEGRAKLVIIDPADLMTEAAANALLKTLEEPGPGRFLILITNRLSSLLPTVRSRCQVVRFNPLPEQSVAAILTARGISSEQASTAAAFSGGSLTRATEFLDEGLQDRVMALIDLFESTVSPTPLGGLEIIENLKRGQQRVREEVLALLDMAPIVLSELLRLCTDAEDAAADAGRSSVDRLVGGRLREVSKKISVVRIAAIMIAFHSAKQAILNNNMNPQLALEGMLMSTRGRSYEIAAQRGFLRL